MGLRQWIGDAQPDEKIATSDSTKSAEPLAFVVLTKMNDKAALDAITGHMGLERLGKDAELRAINRNLFNDGGGQGGSGS